jgi:hypothetical protein
MTAHFDGPADAQDTLLAAGFSDATLHAPRAHAHTLGLPAPDAPDYLALIEARVGKLPEAPAPGNA